MLKATRLLNHEEKLAVTGLGYVGMPLAIAFAKKIDVIGFDLNSAKIMTYKNGIDPTNEVGDEAIRSTTVYFTDDEKELSNALFHIVAVPTPINLDKTPDLTPVINASRIVGRNLRKGAIIVYESTVYPGVTENICIPIIEEESGLKCGVDFKVGYSPERINPVDRVHRLENIKKIVSGIDQETVDNIKSVYDLVIEAGTYPVSNIKTAEAIKVVENSQRDINIAFMNELAMVFDRMGIDTNEVVDGMNTKWNALGFRPGLVGGHCIGVDPYYFVYEAEQLGYHSQIILSGRKVNDGMGEFIAESAIRQMILAGQTPKYARVAVFGLTFKENCPDIRNTKVVDIIHTLQAYGISPIVVDPWVTEEEARREYNLQLSSIRDTQNLDCAIFAVAHEEFKKLSREEILAFFRQRKKEKNVLIDVKGIFDTERFTDSSVLHWRL